MDAWNAMGWALSEFGGAELGHRARTKRAVQLAATLLQSPASSIPKMCESAAKTKGAYRFLSSEHVAHAQVLSAHIARTVERCSEEEAVLVVQDTTALTFGKRRHASGLGPVNDQPDVQGLLAHTALAISVGRYEVLGVLDQHVWARSKTKHVSTESARARRKRPRESEHWAQAQTRVAESFARAESLPTPRIIAVFDREGDIFEAFEQLDALGHSFIIRAVHNRLIEPENTDDERSYSLDHARTAPVIGHKTVHVPARGGGRGARTASLEIRATSVRLQPPKNRDRSGASLTVNIVLVVEPQPPAGCEPLCWFLLTREPIDTAEQVLAIVRGYEARWLIEEFHMGLKTGCSCEDRQLETREALEVFLAFASVVAWQLLRMRDAARRPEPRPASDLLTKAQLTVLRARQPRLPKELTIERALRAIASMGGFVDTSKKAKPGWRTMWWGFEKLLVLEQGYLIGRDEWRFV